MKNIFIIYKKELIDSLRDRKTVFVMILFPLLLVPLIMIGASKFTIMQVKKSETKLLHIGISGSENAPELIKFLKATENIKLYEQINPDSLSAQVIEGQIDGALLIPENYQEKLDNNDQAIIQILYKGSDSFKSVNRRLIPIIEKLDSEIVAKRLKFLNLTPATFDAIRVDKIDLSTAQETIGIRVGGYLPYFFILFGFMGAMYPGIDLGVGEKERGTLETILSTPTKRIQIVLGKFLLVMSSAILTSIISILGIFFVAKLFSDLPTIFMEAITNMFSLKILFVLFTLILPISVLFAAVILSISIYAKSFKEAQSMLAPLNLLIFIPAFFGLLPGIDLNIKTALIPIMNVALATKEVLAGTINPLLLAEVYISLLILAGISLLFCVKWFQREETLFRT